jgi:hypothetical protein
MSQDAARPVLVGTLYRERGQSVTFVTQAPTPLPPARHRPGSVARVLALAHHSGSSMPESSRIVRTPRGASGSRALASANSSTCSCWRPISKPSSWLWRLLMASSRSVNARCRPGPSSGRSSRASCLHLTPFRVFTENISRSGYLRRSQVRKMSGFASKCGLE